MKIKKLFVTPAVVFVMAGTLLAQAPMQHFITVHGDQLMEGDQPFRFLSLNTPNLLLVEDNVPFAEENPWRLPDTF